MAEQVDCILTGGTVVTMNRAFDTFTPGAVALRDDTIVAVGPAAEIEAAYAAADTVDCSGKVIMPGLINAHTHVPMTLLRGLNDDLRLDVWLGYLMPVEREFVTPEFVRLGTRIACAEMIRSGVTSFADMYYFEEAIAAETAEIGMRALLGESILVFPTPDASNFEEGLERCRAFIEAWKDHPLVKPAVAPHAWYTATPELLHACAALAKEYNVPIHTHIAETGLEVENCRTQHQTSVVEWNAQHGLLENRLIAAHCVHINGREMRILREAGAGVAHNPSSNLKLSSGLAPVAEMLESGVNVGIGTDGTASNNDLDMFEEVRLAAFVAKVVRSDPTDLPARQALELATSGGARAIHMGEITGSLVDGKRADVIVVDMDGLHNTPHFNNNPDGVYSRLVYAAKSTDVRHVICNGRWLMRDRELLTIDEDATKREAAKVAQAIDTFVIEREASPYNKLVLLENVERVESYEVQIKIRLESTENVKDWVENSGVHIRKSNIYKQFDTYFIFDGNDPDAARLRYREDDYLDERGNVYQTRARLTLLGAGHHDEYPNAIFISRSRFIAPATKSLRFYREYFDPLTEQEVVKLRRRWRILYQDTDIAINLDQVLTPAQDGYFLEIKTRTWSQLDALRKVELIETLLGEMGIDTSQAIHEEYIDIASVV